MERKVCVFICSGCGISEAFDVSKVEEASKEAEPRPAVVKVDPCLCGDDGYVAMSKIIEEEKPTHVVIGACSQRLFQDRFCWNGIFVERVNLREQCAWSHEAGDVGTLELAQDLMRMGIAKCGKAEMPEPHLEEPSQTVLVIGGGISGMSAALYAADAGYDVVLIEKSDKLGGFAKNIYKTYPSAPPYDEVAENPVFGLMERCETNPRIKVLLGTTVEEISGAPGKFSVKAGGKEFVVGAIVVATGFRPYDIGKLSHLGGGVFPDVVGSDKFEEMLLKGEFRRPSDGKEIKKVAFIQCAGSRDKDHLPYCSGTCCLTSLKQAHLFVKDREDREAYIVYKDIRTPAQHERFYEAMQNDARIMLAQGTVKKVVQSDGVIEVDVEDSLTLTNIRIDADLVVLALGKVPNSDGPILNLRYRKGKELPTLKYGFPDSNFICFPYETERTGIYTCGCVRQPMDMASCMEDAAGAAMKAIQCIYATSKGRAVHPRAWDLSFPDFFLQRCTQCKRCTEECPFGTLDEDEKGTPMPNPTRCRRCGVCMGACPERIVSFKDYSVQIISDMIKAIHVPEEFEEKPRYVGFICENDAYPALDLAGLNHLKYSPLVRFIPVRCLGSVNRVWIADALSRGIDGVLLIGCKFGDDYQCHFIKGSELCNKRMENVQEDLNRLALERERIKLVQLAINDYHKLPQIIDEFVESVNALGMNPYKGF